MAKMTKHDKLLELIETYSLTITVPNYVSELATPEELSELETIARKHAKIIIEESVVYLASQLNKPTLTVIK